MFNCSHCSKSFDSYRKLNGHKSIHRIGGRYSKSRRKSKIIYCKQCGIENVTQNKSYCSNKCQQEWQYKNVHIHKILKGSSTNFFRFLVDRDGRKCSKCKRKSWNKNPIPLDIEHIDGNPINNDPSNVCLICPNCHRQTDTWGMKKKRRELRAMGQMGRRSLDMAKKNGSIPLSPTT